eukprot:scaffold1540_cov359-Prasinococcus_capsulatus_cf.AAC.2
MVSTGAPSGVGKNGPSVSMSPAVTSSLTGTVPGGNGAGNGGEGGSGGGGFGDGGDGNGGGDGAGAGGGDGGKSKQVTHGKVPARTLKVSKVWIGPVGFGRTIVINILRNGSNDWHKLTEDSGRREQRACDRQG